MMQGPHAGFILAAYGLSVATIAGLIAWIVVDHARQTAILADLTARGVTRRSAAQPKDAA
ncbi:heme exporter protein CcmD [Phreatobacter stygius]|uniref:Heme exporter protein D n=2 Tax=Phreatobacter stygius TaxID=1940610 RepID=A0A4D7BFF0_9HYPH|nr:heme exporter protein CcmD [Phreatobacter stygius]